MSTFLAFSWLVLAARMPAPDMPRHSRPRGFASMSRSWRAMSCKAAASARRARPRRWITLSVT